MRTPQQLKKKELTEKEISEYTKLMQSFVDMGFNDFVNLWDMMKGKRGKYIMKFCQLPDKELYKRFREEITKPHKQLTIKTNEYYKSKEIEDCIIRAMEKLDSNEYDNTRKDLKILKKIYIDGDNLITVGIGYKMDNRQYKIQTTGVFQLSEKEHPNLYAKYSLYPMVERTEGAFTY